MTFCTIFFHLADCDLSGAIYGQQPELLARLKSSFKPEYSTERQYQQSTVDDWPGNVCEKSVIDAMGGGTEVCVAFNPGLI